MRNLNLLLILFLIPFFSMAQTNFRPAYAIKNNGDTLKGYIDYREWRETPLNIDFKQNLTDKQVPSLSPDDIKSFHSQGRVSYVKYIGPLSTDKNTYPDLLHKLDTTTITKTVFLKVVIAGEKVSLLSNTDEIKTRLFVQESGSAPQELKYHQYY